MEVISAVAPSEPGEVVLQEKVQMATALEVQGPELTLSYPRSLGRVAVEAIDSRGRRVERCVFAPAEPQGAGASRAGNSGWAAPVGSRLTLTSVDGKAGSVVCSLRWPDRSERVTAVLDSELTRSVQLGTVAWYGGFESSVALGEGGTTPRSGAA